MTSAIAIDEFLPATQTELSRWMGENASGAARPIYPVGGRTAWHFGPQVTVPGISLCTTSLAKVIDYPARDMTGTVEAGVRWCDLARRLQADSPGPALNGHQGHPRQPCSGS